MERREKEKEREKAPRRREKESIAIEQLVERENKEIELATSGKWCNLDQDGCR